MIAILDHGAGNVRSVARALEVAGGSPLLTSSPAEIAAADALVVPGQGSAVDVMRNIERLGMEQPLRDYVASGRPFLGVCLGEQIIFESSDEGNQPCLGLIPGRCHRLPGGQKVPHMGWNSVRLVRSHPLLEGIPDNSYFYFVHSYYVAPANPDAVVGVTDYGVSFASIVASGSIFAAQFHPEKSADLGLRMYANFVRLARDRAATAVVQAAAAIV
ncbi:MAG: imidazole glycerol phosphate synthase subunit HisH [Chloroflexota bacterium]